MKFITSISQIVKGLGFIYYKTNNHRFYFPASLPHTCTFVTLLVQSVNNDRNVFESFEKAVSSLSQLIVVFIQIISIVFSHSYFNLRASLHPPFN